MSEISRGKYLLLIDTFSLSQHESLGKFTFLWRTLFQQSYSQTERHKCLSLDSSSARLSTLREEGQVPRRGSKVEPCVIQSLYHWFWKIFSLKTRTWFWQQRGKPPIDKQVFSSFTQYCAAQGFRRHQFSMRQSRQLCRITEHWQFLPLYIISLWKPSVMFTFYVLTQNCKLWNLD